MTWTILPIAQLGDFSAQWDALNRRCGYTPLLDTRFVLALTKHFASSREKFAYFGDQQAPQAMCLIEPQKPGCWSTFQPSQAPLGCWLQASGLSTKELSSSLLDALPGPDMVFSVTQQDPRLLSRPDDSEQYSTMDYIDTASITIDKDYDEYWASRSKNLRQNLKRQKNRLEREEITPSLKVIEAADQMALCIEQYGKLESAGWKNETNTAIHPDNSQGRFYRDILESFAATGEAIVFQYWYNDLLCATDLCIRSDNEFIILKTTYDESIKTSSPAMLMHREAFEYIFGLEGVTLIEFYGRVMEWHQKWTSDIRQLYHINYYSPKAILAKRAMGLVKPITALFK